MSKPKTDIDSLFSKAKNENTFLKVCAPMVRYSKLQFRTLIKKYDVDLCFTPMILADSFCQSAKARDNEFSTNTSDTPVIIQFAAKTTYDFVGASELVYPFVDGVDLNCGCPQRWAIKDGYGCSLLNKPEVIFDVVRSFKNRLPNSFSISVKIRLLNNIKDSVELCRRIENCGVNFITVHGRKTWQKNSEPVNISMLTDIKKSMKIPLIANGNIKSLKNAQDMYETVKCEGVMAAQGILTNPALFSDISITPISCIQEWINICYSQEKFITFQCFHHHLVFMMEKVLNKKQKQIFNNLTNFSSVYEFLNENLKIVPEYIDEDTLGKNIDCEYSNVEYSTLKRNFGVFNESTINNSLYDINQSQGKYFLNYTNKTHCDLDYMISSLFNEE